MFGCRAEDQHSLDRSHRADRGDLGEGCRPVPRTASVRAVGLASNLVATPLAAPVRIWPRWSASIIAFSLPSAAE